METMSCPRCLGQGTDYPAQFGTEPCPVCQGKGWVISDWGDLWLAQRAQEPLAYVMDWCDGCNEMRPVVLLHVPAYGEDPGGTRWLCPDCAAWQLSAATRWATFTRIAWATIG